MIFDAQIVPAACQVVVPLKEGASRTPSQCVIGAVFRGSQADLQKVVDWSKAHGLDAGDIKPDEADPSRFAVMLVFFRETAAANIIALFGENRSGRFGAAQMNVIIAPKSGAADGFDLATEVKIGPVDGIVEPKP